MNKLKEFLRDIFAPRISVHNYSSMSQSDMNKVMPDMSKAFQKMNEAFEEMNKVFSKFSK